MHGDLGDFQQPALNEICVVNKSKHHDDTRPLAASYHLDVDTSEMQALRARAMCVKLSNFFPVSSLQ